MIEVRNLTKKYGNHTAVDHLNFDIEAGHIYGFLGPNGAGKSTTMNMITGCLAPTEGDIFIDGKDIYENAKAAKRAIGYLPEIPPLYPDMTPEEYLLFVAEAKGLKSAEKYEQVYAAMEETGLVRMKDRLIKKLSKGYRQRVGIAQAILGEPMLIILDEPTVGLDPKQIIEIRNLITRLGQSRTIIISSHILSEVSAVCDHVMIIANGKLVASDTLENIRLINSPENRLLMTARGERENIESILNGFDEIIEYHIDNIEDGQYDITIDTAPECDIRERLFYAFAEKRIAVSRLVKSEPSLEEVFLRLTDIPADNGDEEENIDDGEIPADEDGDGYTPVFSENGGEQNDGDL